jgi:hypothetical protein
MLRLSWERTGCGGQRYSEKTEDTMAVICARTLVSGRVRMYTTRWSLSTRRVVYRRGPHIRRREHNIVGCR